MIMDKETLERIEELKHEEELFYILLDKLQCYFDNDLRLIDFLKNQCSFTTDDITKYITYYED
jgi:hypothetical protein